MTARYHTQDSQFDLVANTGTNTIAFTPENTCVENIALWVTTTQVCVFTVYASINGIAVVMGTGNTTANKPTKVYTEAGPYPVYNWPLSVKIDNSANITASHADVSWNALIRAAYQ